MFKHGEISTEISKGQFVFTTLSFVVTSLTAIALIVYGKGDALAVFSFIMLLIVALASLAVLVGLLSDYAYIKEDVLYMHYIFKGSSINIKDIGKIELKNNVYHVYDLKNGEVGTINALALGIDSITNELYRKNVSFI